MPVPGACPARCPGDPPPPPVQICVKRGDRYAPVDTAGMHLGDHKATLTPPRGKPLIIATPMVAKATYGRARGGGGGGGGLSWSPRPPVPNISAMPTGKAGAPCG